MLALKDRGGVEPIEAIIARAYRLHALERIDGHDLARLEAALNKALAIIADMHEVDANGRDI